MTAASLTSPPYKPRVRPLKAAKAMIGFLRNKEATYEVFQLVRALDGPIVERNFRQFRASPVGQRVLKRKQDLLHTLSDRNSLAAMPEGSLGRAYLDFITREGLSAEGFQAEMDATGENMDKLGEDRARFIYRFRHTHDLYHVLTGYGRDFVGELSLVSFTRRQNNSRGLAVLVFFSRLKAMRDYPGLGVNACISEGLRLGRQAGNLMNADWEALLRMPLHDVRKQLKIGPPRRYLAIKTSAELLDQRYREDLLGAAQPA